MTARHYSDGDGKEHEKEERQEQGDHVVPASLLPSLMRPQVCLTAHCVPFRNGKREGRATPGTSYALRGATGAAAGQRQTRGSNTQPSCRGRKTTPPGAAGAVNDEQIMCLTRNTGKAETTLPWIRRRDNQPPMIARDHDQY